MLRWISALAATLVAATGAVLIARGQPSDEALLPAAPEAPAVVPGETPRDLPVIPEIEEPPAADPLTKEQKRFNRVDKDGDEIITLSEMVHPRRGRFANLDLDKDGKLSFEEWAITTIEKFEGADADGDARLTRAEFATTAPKPRKPKPACRC
ncbi:hypothetical protein [Sphingomicrobium astaxanthinifaciens]|uniref:hypothetical protein n=1 Tax=Sphingomicrobium astaxanthinifaciens TaxID=1227949 RepID=UPI001FCC97EB|nr:hypothetical protein [Sphingomicrobium astaxanthinifaciens]MCJ7422339.1 hypothetical protein [Sphingomicrobium astaxanthinifaciens]